MKTRLIVLLHWLVIVTAYTSFIWLDWKLVFVGILAYWLQIFAFGACILSFAQYKSKDEYFLANYINKFMRKFDKNLPVSKIKLFFDFILPLSYLTLTYIFQNYAGLMPIVRLQ